MGVEAGFTFPESGAYAKFTKKLETAAAAFGPRHFHFTVYEGGGHQSHFKYSQRNSAGYGAGEYSFVSDCKRRPHDQMVADCPAPGIKGIPQLAISNNIYILVPECASATGYFTAVQAAVS